MKKFFFQFFLVFVAFSSAVYAKSNVQYPNITGRALFLVEADRIVSTQKSGISANNAFVYVEPKFSLNFNKNWSIKTEWRLNPNDSFTTRDSTYPERYRTILSANRGLGQQDLGLLVEQLKAQFENEDMQVFAGKFDPTFGTAHNKAKRIGVFTSQFTEDYNLREKMGVGVVALLENSKVTFNSFFNDTTGLSRSIGNNRGRASSDDGIAGNTGTLSSYSLSMDGQNLFGYENWFYNIGHRSLGVSNLEGRAREKGYVFGTEYLYKLGEQTSIIPFIEVTRINNFTGERNRDATYSTIALIGNYSSWTASISKLSRHIKQTQDITPTVNDRQLQLSIGYKFTNNLTVDVSRSSLKEGGNRASVIGMLVSYVHEF